MGFEKLTIDIEHAVMNRCKDLIGVEARRGRGAARTSPDKGALHYEHKEKVSSWNDELLFLTMSSPNLLRCTFSCPENSVEQAGMGSVHTAAFAMHPGVAQVSLLPESCIWT